MESLRSNKKNHYFIVLLLLLFITLTRFNIWVGFSLKIYMLFLIVLFFIYLRHLFFRTLYHYEILLVLFYFAYCLSGAFSQYPELSLRIIFGVILVVGCYFIMRFIMEIIEIATIEKAITNAGILFNAVSLFMYIIGLTMTGLASAGKNQIAYGLLIDRDYPRLIGLVDDPNIFIFYNSMFFFWYLTNLKGDKHIIGFILCMVTNLLTFSRGGLLALLLVVLLYVLFSRASKKIPIVIVSSLGVVFIYIVVSFTTFNLNQIFSSRINDFSTDGGSGRFELWEHAIDYFMSNPLLGIGAFTFAEHYAFDNNQKLYVHNTFLEILVESGIVSFLIYVSFLLMFIITLFKTKLHVEKPFIVLTILSFLLQLFSLSLIINEAFFCFLAIALKYITVYENKGVEISFEQKKYSS